MSTLWGLFSLSGWQIWMFPYTEGRNCIMVFSKNDTYNWKYVMKSIKTNTNSAKGPDKGKIVNKLYCILLTTLELLGYIFFEKKPDIKFIILVSNLKEISPSVFSWKIRFGRKKILNYAYVLKNGVGWYNIFF